MPGLADSIGNLNFDSLSVGRPSFAEACKKGMQWTVLHWQCAFQWPGLPHLVQEALNLNCKKAQTEIEIMLNLCNRRKNLLTNNIPVDWENVGKVAAHGNLPCKSYIQTRCKYVEAHSGGIDGPLIRELLSFSKTFATTSKGTRVWGQEFISNVAGLNFGKSEKYPLVATALMETNLACPAHKVVDGVCRLLVPGNVSVFSSKGNRALVKEAEQLMTDSRNLVESMGFDKAKVMKAQGMLNVRCICFIAKKGKELEGKTFAAITDIAQAFINDVEKNTNSKVLNPWASKPSSSTQPEAAAEKVAAVQMPPHTSAAERSKVSVP